MIRLEEIVLAIGFDPKYVLSLICEKPTFARQDARTYKINIQPCKGVTCLIG